MDKGIIAGFPIVDIKVVLLDGKFHPVDSSDMAFQTCGSICFKNGFNKANPILLEPMMKIEINTPDDYIGGIVGYNSSGIITKSYVVGKIEVNNVLPPSIPPKGWRQELK